MAKWSIRFNHGEKKVATIGRLEEAQTAEVAIARIKRKFKNVFIISVRQVK